MCFTSKDFYALTDFQQQEFIEECAVYIGKRTDGGFLHILHNIAGLYIEETRGAESGTWYNFSCVEDTELLLPYTEELSMNIYLS